MDEVSLRSLTPGALGILVRRGADFAAAEDAVQDALVEAVRVWPADPPLDPKGRLGTVALGRVLGAAPARGGPRGGPRRAGWSPCPGAGSSTRPGPTAPAAGGRTWSTTNRRPARSPPQ